MTSLTASALSMAAGLHATAAVTHQSTRTAAAGFAAVAVVQLASAIALVVRPTVALRFAVAASTTGFGGLLLLSRVVGIDVLGDGSHHGFDGLATVTLLAEAVALATVPFALRWSRHRFLAVPSLAGVAVLATAIGFVTAPGHGVAEVPVVSTSPAPATTPASATTAGASTRAPTPASHGADGSTPHSHP